MIEYNHVEDLCIKNPDAGNGKLNIPKFYFDSEKSDCFPFIFHGIGGNENNFDTIHQCRATCTNEPAPSDIINFKTENYDQLEKLGQTEEEEKKNQDQKEADKIPDVSVSTAEGDKDTDTKTDDEKQNEKKEDTVVEDFSDNAEDLELD